MLMIAKQSPLKTALLLDPSLVSVVFWGAFRLMYSCFESLTREVYFVLYFLFFICPFSWEPRDAVLQTSASKRRGLESRGLEPNVKSGAVK